MKLKTKQKQKLKKLNLKNKVANEIKYYIETNKGLGEMVGWY